MLVAPDGIRSMEPNSLAERAGSFLNLIERPLAVGAVGHQVLSETIFTLNHQIPLPGREGWPILR